MSSTVYDGGDELIKYPLAFLVLVGAAFGACLGVSPNLTAASASLADANACIAIAVSGDKVTIPAGSATWSADLTITKAIWLHGSGASSTIITSGGVTFSPSSGEEAKVFEMDGIDFEGNRTHFNETSWGKSPTITGLKIHDNKFNGVSGGRAIWLAGREFGVLYNNSFVGNFIDISVIGAGVPNGNFFPLCFGCASYPYIEDNSVGNGVGAEFVSETGQGGRMAFRHNTIAGYDSGAGSEVFDLHGEQNSGGWTATSEYYHNIVGTLSTPFRWMNDRGGQAIIINNAVTKSTGGSLAFEITEFQDHGGNGICNNYPIAYNSSESYCSPISGSCLETQVNNSFYAGNTMNGSPQSPSLGTPGGGSCGASPPWGDAFYIVQNREYWLPTSGLASGLPATCTANGNTYYDATDTDVIYKCTSTNTWTVFYQPYTYPHPLRSVSCVAGSSVSSCTGTTPAASSPTFLPVAGAYTGSRSVTISTTSIGAIICYNTTGFPATNGSAGCTTGTLYSGPVTVSVSQTLFAAAGGTGFSDSTIASAVYVINPSLKMSGVATMSGSAVMQ